MTTQPLSVLSIYRGKVGENRGTPIRVRSILERLSHTPGVTLTVASWDGALPFSASHVHLSNDKRDDLRALRAAAHPVDVVIGHTMGTWYYLLYLKLFARKKIVLEMHGFLEEEKRLYGDIGALRYWAEKAVYGFFYCVCDLIVTCSATETRILSKFNRNVYTMYGGVDALFSPAATPGSFIQKKEGETIIGYAGNTRKWQGIDFLAAAFARLRREDPAFRLAVLTGETKGLPQGDGVQIVSGIPHADVPRFLAECDILVIPRLLNRVSRLGAPSKLFEYLAMGKAVVVAALGDMDTIVHDGVNGRTFPPGDESAFVRTLRELKNPEVRGALGQRAAETIREHFDWDKEIAILVSHLVRLAPRGR